MNVPIRILVSGVPDPSGVTTWGDVISNWEAYAIEWDAAAALVANGEAPILDMFGDEGVTVKQILKDLSDPAKLFTSYSRSFTVPASKKNNLIFKHYYNIDITNGLESRSLIPAKILMNNRTYKAGNIRVDSVEMSGGKPMHYKISFVGALSELAKRIGQDTLTSLDFSSSTISPYLGNAQFYNNTPRDIVFPLSSRREQYKLNTSGRSLGESNVKNVAYVDSPDMHFVYIEDTSGDFYYPLFATQEQASYYDSENGGTGTYASHTFTNDPTGRTWFRPNTNSTVNGTSAPFSDSTLGTSYQYSNMETLTNNDIYRPLDYGFNEFDLVGALKVGRILTAIESKYDFTIQGATDFDYVQDLYLWLHKQVQAPDADELSSMATGYSGSALTDVVYNTNSIVFTGQNTNKLEGYKLRFKVDWIGSASVTASLYIDGYKASTVTTKSTYGNYFAIDSAAGVVQVIVESDVAVASNVTVDIATYATDRDFGQVVTANTLVTASANAAAGNSYLVSEHLPEVKVTEFLANIFKMFNIVAEVDGDTITTKHYEHYMSEGTIKDVSEYVEIDSYSISRPNLYSALDFRFEDGKTALEDGYIQVNGKKYGQLVYEQVSQGGARLAGEAYELMVNSSRIPLEPLYNQNGVHQDTAYCLFSDLKGAKQSTKCAFTYIASVTSGVQLAWNNGSTVVPYDDYILPTNIYSENAVPTKANSTLGLWFSEELDEYNPESQLVGIGLWNGFYKGITSQMFDSDKRKAKFTAMLPQPVLLDLSLADTLRIGNHYYQIEAITTEYLTGVSELELVLVGQSLLPYFETRTIYIDNDSLTEALYITYLGSNGEIIKDTIGAGLANFGVSMIGQFLSTSHEDYSVSLTSGGGGGGGGTA